MNPNAARVSQLAASDDGSDLEAVKELWFYPSDGSRAIADEWWARVHERTKEMFTRGQKRLLGRREIHLSQVLACWLKRLLWANGRQEKVRFEFASRGLNCPSLLTLTLGFYGRLHEIQCPVLITNGKDDFMVPTPESYAMFQQIPTA